MSGDTLRKGAYISVILAAASAGIYCSVKYLLPAALPIILAYIISSLVRPAAQWMYRYAKIPHAVTKITLVVLTFFLSWQLIYALGSKLIDDIGNFAEETAKNLKEQNNPLRNLINRFEEAISSLPSFLRMGDGKIGEMIYTVTENTANRAASEISSFAAKSAGALVASGPKFLLALFTFLVSLFYFCTDSSAMSSVLRIFPEKIRKTVIKAKGKITGAIGKYAKAYFVIMLVNFAILLIGFSFLKIKYSLALAALIALADLLPVIGIGTALLPWSLGTLLLGNYLTAIGLLVLYAVITLVRQLIEPHLIGKVTGLHPLVAITVSYIALSLFGVAGMIAAPLLTGILFSLSGITETS